VHCAQRVRPKDAVDTPGVKTEGAKSLLEFGHVVAAQVWRAQIKVAISEFPAGLDQGLPGRFITRSGHRKTACGLKGAQRGFGSYPEDPWVDTGWLESCRAKSPLQITNGVALASKG
jgi:hypothetical protein